MRELLIQEIKKMIKEHNFDVRFTKEDINDIDNTELLVAYNAVYSQVIVKNRE
jgi:hypothetical protein